MTTLRFGSYELTSARRSNGARRRRFSGVNDCLSLLSRSRIDRGAVRMIVRRAGVSARTDDEALRALAALVFRGAYLVLERPPVKVPRLELPAEEPEIEVYEREFAEDKDDGLPTAIVPREYPLLASREKQAVDTAVALANAELDKQIHRSMPREPEDKVPEIYRTDSRTTGKEIQAITNTMSDNLQRLEYTFPADEPSDQLPALYRSGAEETKGGVVGVITTHVDSLSRLEYEGLDKLESAATVMHSQATPREYQGISREKRQGVKDATNVAANALDALLYQGMPE